MRTNEELKSVPNLIILQTGEDGGSGRMIFGKLDASVIWSTGAGWDHVSITPYKKSYTPSWADMCKLKSMFFYPEETVLQYHPAQSQYVNLLENCLHLWRPQNYEIPLPPPALIGPLTRMSRSEAEKTLREVCEILHGLTGGM